MYIFLYSFITVWPGVYFINIFARRFCTAFLVNGEWWTTHRFGDILVINLVNFAAQFGAECWWNWTTIFLPNAVRWYHFVWRKSSVKSTPGGTWKIFVIIFFFCTIFKMRRTNVMWMNLEASAEFSRALLVTF